MSDTSKYSDLELNDPKVMGARIATETMLFYYMSALSGKVDDVKQYMAKRIPAMIELTEEQTTYIATSIDKSNAVLTSLDTVTNILKNIQEQDKLDAELMDLAIRILQSMRDECSNAIYTYMKDAKKAMRERG